MAFSSTNHGKRKVTSVEKKRQLAVKIQRVCNHNASHYSTQEGVQPGPQTELVDHICNNTLKLHDNPLKRIADHANSSKHQKRLNLANDARLKQSQEPIACFRMPPEDVLNAGFGGEQAPRYKVTPDMPAHVVCLICMKPFQLQTKALQQQTYRICHFML